MPPAITRLRGGRVRRSRGWLAAEHLAAHRGCSRSAAAAGTPDAAALAVANRAGPDAHPRVEGEPRAWCPASLVEDAPSARRPLMR